MRTYTAKQRQVLEIIRDSYEEYGIAPTLEEIGQGLGGISRVAALDHLRALERKGAIRRIPRQRRAIELLDPEFLPPQGVPLAGTIAAGVPIAEIEDREDVVLDEYLRVSDRCFLLRVQGNSMIEDQIRDGDLVLVEKRRSARDGETVVAVVDGEATLKRLYREKGGRVRLQPANASMSARRLKSSQVQIRGVVRGVIRRL